MEIEKTVGEENRIGREGEGRGRGRRGLRRKVERRGRRRKAERRGVGRLMLTASAIEDSVIDRGITSCYVKTCFGPNLGRKI